VIWRIADSAKAEPSMFSREAGRQIDINDEHRVNAEPPISVSFDPDSNFNDDSDLHP
jgi:hypothetical protein